MGERVTAKYSEFEECLPAINEEYRWCFTRKWSDTSSEMKWCIKPDGQIESYVAISDSPPTELTQEIAKTFYWSDSCIKAQIKDLGRLAFVVRNNQLVAYNKTEKAKRASERRKAGRQRRGVAPVSTSTSRHGQPYI